MNNLHTFDEFINEDWFNPFSPNKSEKNSNEMKIGQIVCLPSDMDNIIHVYQLVDPKNNKGIFIGNFKSNNNVWTFRISRYLDNKTSIIKNYRSLKDNERKMMNWYFYSKERIDELKKVTNLAPIL
jgi:transposase-like protein